jgi:hypothetical protein
MQIRWDDVGRTDQPRVYEPADGRAVQVGAMDIARWLEHPTGAFDTYWHAGTPQRSALLTLTDFHEKPALAGAGERCRA